MIFNSKWMFFIVPLVIALIWVVSLGFRDDKDQDWFDMDVALRKDYFTLDKAVDSLQMKYNAFHGFTAADDSFAFKAISKPFLPTMEYSKFAHYFDLVSSRRLITISGVAGSGNSSIVARIAELIGTGDHRMDILCAPQYELEYHKKYIGYFETPQHFVKGTLLQFWDKCKRSPKEKFVCMIDNFDKINPETLFGPELWWKLDDPRYNVVFVHDTIIIPENFYLLNVTHAIAGARVELNNEHFRRFGGLENLPVSKEELILFLRSERVKLEKDLKKQIAQLSLKPEDTELSKEIKKTSLKLEALRDTQNVKRMVYFFDKANALIEDRYSKAHGLGQWSEIRRLYLPGDYSKLQDKFLAQVNAYRPTTELKKEDFGAINYTISHNGGVQNSYFFYKAFMQLTNLGFLNELLVAIVVGIIGAISGWFLVRKKHAEMRRFTQRIYKLMEDFENRDKEYDEVNKELRDLKREFDDLVIRQKISHTEATFFYSFIDDKIRNVEIAREVNESFLRLVDAFLDDKILTDTEYRKLNQFLESIKHRISNSQYMTYKNDIERIYKEYGVISDR